MKMTHFYFRAGLVTGSMDSHSVLASFLATQLPPHRSMRKEIAGRVGATHNELPWACCPPAISCQAARTPP